MQPFIQFCKVSAYSSVCYMAVLYKYSYLQNHPNCANLLLFKNVWIVPFLPIPIQILKACIQINFGVGKLLYVLSHIVFRCLFIFVYLQEFLSTEPYRSVHLKSAMQWCGLPGLRKHKKGLDSAKKMATEYAYVLSEKKKRKRKIKRK